MVEPVEFLRTLQKLNLQPDGPGFGAYLPKDAWSWLVYCLLSLRTKDAVSHLAYQRLAAQVPNLQAMLTCPVEKIASFIYPCGFYATKAKNLKKIALMVQKRYEGIVPKTREELLSLPGVGLKTANFVLSKAYGLPAICVDIHVHRISHRLGWVHTRTPNETEQALQNVVPSQWWAPLNSLMVPFGQHICRPVAPHCAQCPFDAVCPKIKFR